MTSFGVDGAATVSRGDERTKLLWAGGTVFDVILDGSQAGGALDLFDQWGVRGDVPETWESNLGAILANASPHRIEIFGPPPQLPAS